MIGYTCVGCKIEMICTKNNVPLIHFSFNERENGIDALRYGDVYRCPKCGAQFIAGLGNQILGHDLSDEEEKKILNEFFVEVKR